MLLRKPECHLPPGNTSSERGQQCSGWLTASQTANVAEVRKVTGKCKGNDRFKIRNLSAGEQRSLAILDILAATTDVDRRVPDTFVQFEDDAQTEGSEWGRRRGTGREGGGGEAEG